MENYEQKRQTADSFGTAAESYLQSTTHSGGEDLDLLAEWCADARLTLDIATGAGHTAGAIDAAGGTHVVAVDVSPSMARTAVDEYDVMGIVGDAERLPFRTNSCDAVSCRIAAHHFPDPPAFLDEVARVLRAGGTFAFEDSVAPERDVFGDFINEIEAMRDPTHVESYSPSQWRDWLTEAGFTVDTTQRMKTQLDFDFWVEAQSVSAERRAEIQALLRDADPETKDTFDITVDDGTVRSFSNHKLMVRAIVSN